MRKLSLIGGIAAIALIPTLAAAQQQTCEEQTNHRVAGTVVGGVGGALAGSAIAGRGHKGDGAILGAVVGAVIGNQVTKPTQDCYHAYGYYDRNGAWHATDVQASNAQGYYDRDGNWVDGAPNGYYDQSGRWMSASNDQRGYYDDRGRWIPGGAQGYYDTDGRYVTATRAQARADARDDQQRRMDLYGYYDTNGAWHASNTTTASGYYDRDGRWVDGTPNGYYDSNGRWMTADASQRGYRDQSGRWVPAGVAGYYDTDGRYVTASRAQMMADNRRADSYGQYDRNGNWVASGATRGSATGYYDRNGQWVNGAPGGGYGADGRWDVNASSAGNYGADVSYNSRWTGAPGEISAREDFLDQRIQRGASDGSLSRYQAQRALTTLNAIRSDERRLARQHRGLTSRDMVYLQRSLDSLSADVRRQRHDR
ncbi:MAG: hypothetical protein JWP35_3123 [Caulobacter sp.]|nr:hypothetical protein [Caulobacter sp.]